MKITDDMLTEKSRREAWVLWLRPAEQEQANRKIARLRRHGTRREKTLIRQWRGTLPTSILEIIKGLK